MLRLRDIMATDLLAFSPEVTIRDAMEALAARHVSGAPIIAGNKVVGLVSATDLIAFAAELREDAVERAEVHALNDADADNTWDRNDEPPGTFFHELWREGDADVVERMAHVASPGWSALAEHTVSEAMSTAIKSLPPETPVERAAQLMREAGMHRILVMQGDDLLGLVSTSDIAHAVADHKLTTRERVFGARAGFDPRGWPGPYRSH